MNDVLLFSVDVEATGPIPSPYSMLSIGACVVGNPDTCFYAELTPMSAEVFVPEAVRIGVQGLKLLEGAPAEMDYRKREFSPEATLRYLKSEATPRRTAMRRFARWVKEAAGDKRPIFAADNPVFDGMFTFWYLHQFAGVNPFFHSGIAMNSVCKGIARDMRSSLKRLKLKAPRGTNHNALDDARHNAMLFEQALAKYDMRDG